MAVLRPNPRAEKEKARAERQEFGPEHVAEIRQLFAEADADWERLYRLYAEYPSLSPDYPVELLIKPLPARPPRANMGTLGIISRIRIWLGVLSRGPSRAPGRSEPMHNEHGFTADEEVSMAEWRQRYGSEAAIARWRQLATASEASLQKLNRIYAQFPELAPPVVGAFIDGDLPDEPPAQPKVTSKDSAHPIVKQLRTWIGLRRA